MVYFLSFNRTNSVGEAPLYRSNPLSLGKVIPVIHISVTLGTKALLILEVLWISEALSYFQKG
jgi:hypothetical protein